MSDRNLSKYYRGGRYGTREGMILEIPPSGFDWGSVIPPVIDPFAESATQAFPLGTKLIYGQKTFRYAKCGGTGISIVGVLVQAVVPLAGHINEAIDEPVVGDTGIAFTPNTSPTDDLVADELQDGYIFIYDNTGEGQMYQIKSHPAILGASSGELTLVDPIRVAPIAASTATVLHNPYRGFIIHPSPPTAQPIGFAQTLITANYFCWLVTRGPTCALIDSGGTPVVMGQPATPSAEDDGAVQMFDPDVITEPNAGIVGWIMEIGADAGGAMATYGAVWATLD